MYTSLSAVEPPLLESFPRAYYYQRSLRSSKLMRIVVSETVNLPSGRDIYVRGKEKHFQGNDTFLINRLQPLT